jgi:hypothetical protein
MIALDEIKSKLPSPTPAAAAAVAAAYARHARRCRALLGWLCAELDAHAPQAAGHPGNWGFVVDLAVLDQQLALALRQVAGKEEEQVEQVLAHLEVQG